MTMMMLMMLMLHDDDDDDDGVITFATNPAKKSSWPYCLLMRQVFNIAVISVKSRVSFTVVQTSSGRISIALSLAFSNPSMISAGDRPYKLG
jgi:hypothetical protein